MSVDGLGAARDVVALLEPGCGVTAVTAGQWSMIDAIQALLDFTGPSAITISTWTMGIRDAERAAWLMECGRIKSLRLLVDRSFPVRQPAYAKRIQERFGE